MGSVMDTTTIIMTIVIVVTNFISAVTGFGGTILSMPIAVSMVGFEVARPLLMLTSIVQPLLIAVLQREYINWKVLKTLSFFCVLGIPVGTYLSVMLPTNLLLIFLGVVMLYAGTSGILKLKGIDIDIKSKAVLLGILVLSGIVQGAVLAGGPLFVLYTNSVIKEKMEFRVTLSALWTVLYVVIIAQTMYAGAFFGESLNLALISLPFLLAMVGIANLVAKKISQEMFAYFVNIVLLIGGVVTIITYL